MNSQKVPFFIAQIPSILVGVRVAIAPLLVLDALDHDTTIWFVGGYIIAILSDIFDGIIARRLGVSTVQLRQADCPSRSYGGQVYYKVQGRTGSNPLRF